MPPKDLAAYKMLGRIGKKLTGYRWFPSMTSSAAGEIPTMGHPWNGIMSIWDCFHSFFESWMSRRRPAAGIMKERSPIKSPPASRYILSEEERLKILKWPMKPSAKKAFIVWKAFAHPQLGPVEIGGWREKFRADESSAETLEEEIENDMKFGMR